LHPIFNAFEGKTPRQRSAVECLVKGRVNMTSFLLATALATYAVSAPATVPDNMSCALHRIKGSNAYYWLDPSCPNDIGDRNGSIVPPTVINPPAPDEPATPVKDPGDVVEGEDTAEPDLPSPETGGGDGDNGHGNDAGGVDPSNPGQGGGGKGKP
jgi:hypothetical protein